MKSNDQSDKVVDRYRKLIEDKKEEINEVLVNKLFDILKDAIADFQSQKLTIEDMIRVYQIIDTEINESGY